VLRPELVDLAKCLMLKLIEFSAADRKLAALSSANIYNSNDFLFIAIDFLLDAQVDRLPIKLISYRTRLSNSLKPIVYRASLKPTVYRVSFKLTTYRTRIILPRLGDPQSLGLITLLTYYAVEWYKVECITFHTNLSHGAMRVAGTPREFPPCISSTIHSFRLSSAIECSMHRPSSS